MKRLILVILLTFTPLSAVANDAVRDRIVRELREDGYQDIRIYRTFLGRLRFIARDEDSRREIVVNPATGVILRDYLRLIEKSGSSSGSGTPDGGLNEDDDDYDDDDEYDDDDYDDDDEDDDDDDGDDDESDNSGSGSNNSGSGSDDDDD